MSIRGGYFKKHLAVDLSTGSCERLDLSDAFIEKYIGGRGFGAKFVWDNLRKHNYKIDPLGPENLVAIAPGPLTGMYLPSSGKNSFVSISPATGLYGDSSIGGSFGIELRQCGIDVLTITGRASELSVLFVDNGDTRIIAMPELRGKTSLEAEGMIREKLETSGAHIAVIGPAGENLVKFACVNADWGRNAGRTGFGAILGSKNLKAVIVRGQRDLPVHDIKALAEESDKAYTYLREHKFFRLWQREGLMNVIDYAHEKGILPTYNFKDSVYPRHDKINGATMLSSYKIGDSACFGCAMCCSNICLVKEGDYAGTVVEGPEYESCAMLGSNVGVDDFAAVLAANHLCDELGVDTISMGNLIGAVMEGYEKGIISLADLDGQVVTWGDAKGMLELIRKTAMREGIGNTIAEGARGIIARWPDMEEVILQVKGLEQSAYDSRAGTSMALSYATSDIGAHHTRAWTIAREVEQGQSWSDDDRVKTVIYHQKLRPLFDMFGVCRLPWIELGLNEKHYEYFYRHITGNERTLDELLEVSNDLYNLTRLINTKLGATRKDDSLPWKVQTAPPLTGPNAGKTVNREAFESLLSRYYKARGWDENGFPPASVQDQFND